jgi:hypothetical protein
LDPSEYGITATLSAWEATRDISDDNRRNTSFLEGDHTTFPQR